VIALCSQKYVQPAVLMYWPNVYSWRSLHALVIQVNMIISMYKPQKTTGHHISGSRNLSEKFRIGNFCNVISQNLTTMTATFDKKFCNFLWGVLFGVAVVAGANQKYAVHYHIPSQQHVRVGRSTHRHLQDAQLHEISRYKSIQHCVSKWVIVVGGLVLPCHVLQTLCTVVFPVLLKNVTIIIINEVIFLLMKVQHNVAHLYNVVFSRSCLH